MIKLKGVKALDAWARDVTIGYEGVHLKDFSNSYRNGLAFCAIIHHYRPDLIDFKTLSKEEAFHQYNNELAFTIAQQKLGIPALLDSNDMANAKEIDSLSIILYLSELYGCFEWWKKASFRKSSIYQRTNYDHNDRAFQSFFKMTRLKPMKGPVYNAY